MVPLCLLLPSVAASAQQRPVPPQPDAALATLIRPSNLYVQPDASSSKLITVAPGRELVVNDQNGPWVRVFANVDKPESMAIDHPIVPGPAQTIPVSGWIQDKGLVTAATPNGDQVLFGAAQGYEDAASRADPPPDAAIEARVLYERVDQMFPKSPLTPEAMWRAADIRWQLQKADAATLPSAHAQQPYMRELMDENEMRAVLHKFPHTPWAADAAYVLIENQLCGDWQGSEKCPEKEAQDYLNYADMYPDSTKAPVALYDAAWRKAAAGDMWEADGNLKRAGEDRKNAEEIVERLEQKYPKSRFATRAAALFFEVHQRIPVFESQEP
jgi:outer membrane protein assembly factor BamD (BamD/ComL family)